MLTTFVCSYGDYSPKSNIGKPFFIVWSVFAVPTMTVWIQEMSATVIAAVNEWTNVLAEFTVLPEKGVFKIMMDKNQGLKQWLNGFVQRKAEKRRVRVGLQLQNPDDIALARVETAGSDSGRMAGQEGSAPDVTPVDGNERTVNGGEQDAHHDLARQLAQTIKAVAHDLPADPPKRYSFEEWVRFMMLIRFSRWERGQGRETAENKVAGQDDEEGVIEWDWLGENSPMLADITEAQWLLNRLCESLSRYTRRQAWLVSREA